MSVRLGDTNVVGSCGNHAGRPVARNPPQPAGRTRGAPTRAVPGVTPGRVGDCGRSDLHARRRENHCCERHCADEEGTSPMHGETFRNV